MAENYRHAYDYLKSMLAEEKFDQLKQLLQPSFDPPESHFPSGSETDAKTIESRWDVLKADESTREILADPLSISSAGKYSRNIENFIGTAKVPVGIAGPLRVNGLFAKGDYYVPLATTEAALIASYNRGANLITAAGGCSCALLSEGVSRAPGFVFKTIAEAGEFLAWALTEVETFKKIT